MKKQIPNVFTMLNMASGLMALVFILENNFVYGAVFVFLGIVFDFFDGFAARLLKVQSALGLQLDSMADMVTSGVVPGLVVFKLLSMNPINNDYISMIGFVLTLAAGLRLAKFNIDTRQSNSFIGLPTPAMSIFVVSLPLVVIYGDWQWLNVLITSNLFLIAMVLILSYLMNSEIPLFALKFKVFSWEENKIKYIFLILAILMIILLRVTAIPLIILMYVLLSMVDNLLELKSKPVV